MGSSADKRLMEQLPNLSGLSHEEKDTIIHLLALFKPTYTVPHTAPHPYHDPALSVRTE
jgi:hypothetical protein